MDNTQTFYIKNENDHKKWVKYFYNIDYNISIMSEEYITYDHINKKYKLDKKYNYYITINHKDKSIISSFSKDKLKVLDLDYEIRKLKINKIAK